MSALPVGLFFAEVAAKKNSIWRGKSGGESEANKQSRL
jgi:hypothetical protein